MNTEVAAAEVSFFQQIANFFRTSSFGVLEVISVLVIGILIINILMKLLRQALLASRIDRSLISFVSTVINFILWLMLCMYCLKKMSINLTGIVAMVSALGLAIGLALQDLIGGIANGLVIINTKPFKVDDYVTIGSQSGTVREISLLHTVLVTPDNKKIVLTNKSVYNADITNYSAFANRRLDMSFGIDYGSSIDKAREVLKKLIESNPMILRNPAPFIKLTDNNDNALIITLRVWVKSENFWDVSFELKEQGIKALLEAGIDIPFNQVTLGFRNNDPVINSLIHGKEEK